MAAPAGVSEQKPDDRIYRLLKLSNVPEMRQILDEAAQVSSAGSHIDAGAPETATPAERSFAGRMAADLANGLTNVLVRAMQDLERHISTESDRLSSTFGQQLDRLQSSVESLRPLHQRLDHVAQAGAAVQEQFDELAATTASLREAHERLDSDVAALRLQMDQLSTSTCSRVEEVCRRIAGQERELSTIQAEASGLASKIGSAAERLERHANAIRTIHDSHRQRTLALGQISELLHRLKDGPVSAEASAL
jgi:chromosome segregation ATPase